VSQPPPRPDPSLLVALEGGDQGGGLWAEPTYARLGYDEAPEQVWLRQEVIDRLGRVAASLAEQEMALLVRDGWRPRPLQERLWHEYRSRLAATSGLEGERLDARTREFVSPPDDGVLPAHSTGAAVDLTLCSPDGVALDMGGEFDELTDRSHPDYFERESISAADAVFRDRRRALARAMGEEGFWRLPTEWWHFEHGTRGWADANGAEPVFGEVRSLD
jgi:D-alanyl-D-alanine dipeptidase